MAKLTLLELVQDILSDMTDDVVNSIDDTDAAQQVAQIVKSTYLAMLSNRNWPHTRRLVELVGSSDSTRPTHMTLQDNVKELISIYYDKKKLGETRLLYEEVKWRDPDDFLRFINKRNSDNTNVQTVIDPTGVILLIQNDKAPTYFTSFDESTLVFDSYDSLVDDTLQGSKTQSRGYIFPPFTMDNSFIPDLPEEAFMALQEEAKSRAMSKLNFREDIKAEQESGRQQRWLSRKAWTIKGGIKYPNYGRSRHRGPVRDATFVRNDE